MIDKLRLCLTRNETSSLKYKIEIPLDGYYQLFFKGETGARYLLRLERKTLELVGNGRWENLSAFYFSKGPHFLIVQKSSATKTLPAVIFYKDLSNVSRVEFRPINSEYSNFTMHRGSFTLDLQAPQDSLVFVFNERYSPDWELKINNKLITSHFKVNGFANGWVLLEKDLKETNEFVLFYKPQKLVMLGTTISIVVLISIFVILFGSIIFGFVKK